MKIFPAIRTPSNQQILPQVLLVLPADPSSPSPLTVVLADDHVLDGLPGSGHVHRVGQIRPPQAGVGGLRLEHLVRQEADLPGDVVVLP